MDECYPSHTRAQNRQRITVARAPRKANGPEKSRTRDFNHANMRCHEISADRRRAGDLDRHRCSSLCLRWSAGEAGCGAPAAPPVKLQTYTLPDKSASAGVPAGWTVKGGGAGEIVMAGPQGETITLGQLIVAHNGPFRAGQTEPSGIALTMPSSAKLSDKLTMIFEQTAAVNGTPAPQIKFIYGALLQVPAALGQCGVFIVSNSRGGSRSRRCIRHSLFAPGRLQPNFQEHIDVWYGAHGCGLPDCAYRCGSPQELHGYSCLVAKDPCPRVGPRGRARGGTQHTGHCRFVHTDHQ